MSALVVAGLLVGIVVLVLLLALLVRRDSRPIPGRLRAIVVDGRFFWFLAVPAWFGGVSGLVLSGIGIVSIAVLVLGFLVAALPIGAWWSTRLWSRTMRQDTMLSMIRAGRIDLFIKHRGTVRVHYADKRHGWRPSTADVDGYPAYVAAANDLGDQGPRYRDFSAEDAEHSRSWVTSREAENLLTHGRISAFHYGQPDDFPAETLWNDPTGIKLIRYGTVNHLYVDPAMEPVMIPIARAARNNHGTPTFFVAGRRQA